MLNEPLLESRRQEREEKVHVAKNSLARSLARPDFRAPLVAPSREFVNSRSNFVGAGTTLLRFDGTSPLPGSLAGPSAPSSPPLSLPLVPHVSRRSIAVPSRRELSEESKLEVGGPVSSPAPPFTPALSFLLFYPISRRCPVISPTIVVFRARNLDTPYSPSPTRTIMKDINYNFISNYR